MASAATKIAVGGARNDVTRFIQPAARLLSGKMLLSGKKVMLAGEM